MTGYVILLAVIIVLMIVGFRRARKERMGALEEEMNKLTMPNGELVPCDEELLTFTEQDLDAYNEQNLRWLINYIGHKMHNEDGGCEKWGPLFDMCTHIKHLKGWH